MAELRIAHLSDVHLLTGRTPRVLAHKVASYTRELLPELRAQKLAAALAAAKQGRADHVVLSGDLTELGLLHELEELAGALGASGFAPGQVTLVPGNHDVYGSAGGWTRALEGPLAAYRATGAEGPGKVVELPGATLLPLDVTRHQPILRSAGELTADALAKVESRVHDSVFRDRAMVLIQHYPPFAHASKVLQWFDGLLGWARLADLLGRKTGVTLLHGHLHRVVDRVFDATTRGPEASRSYGTSAVVDDPLGAPRVRFYDVIGGLLAPAILSDSLASPLEVCAPAE